MNNPRNRDEAEKRSAKIPKTNEVADAGRL
jgi:hypothetical protein